jgi:hypothetical protein
VIYYPQKTSLTSPTTPAAAVKLHSGDPRPSFRSAIVVMVICILHVVVLLIMSVYIALEYPSHLQSWANFLGVMAAILASIQYFPQIYTTFRLRRVGSLSIPMMCIQTPGSIVWASSLAARLGKEGWSTWGVYIVTSLLQGTLLGMGVYFEYLRPKAGVSHVSPRLPYTTGNDDESETGHDHGPPSEETPLLQGR